MKHEGTLIIFLLILLILWKNPSFSSFTGSLKYYINDTMSSIFRRKFLINTTIVGKIYKFS